MEIKFTIAMNNEEKKAKNTKEVIMNVNFDGVDPALIQKHALANMKVHWQAQLRNNWDKFIEDGTPDTITFGEPLYESAGRKPLTPEAAVVLLKASGLDAEAIAALVAK